jgi:hypothetical protein
MATFQPDDEAFKSILGPDAVDRMIRQAISVCWLLMPKNKRNVQNVSSEIMRVVERALQNLSEDNVAYDE